jgi:uncharacterized YigZ family protein
MAATDLYKTVGSVSGGLYREKGSKFISAAYPVSNENEIRSIMEEIRKAHHEAKHHCYAYILGESGKIWRANDDGEPSGTAGRPILGKIKSYGLKNVLVVVSRYFGGTLLGVSGLINAYKSAAESALSNAVIIEQAVLKTLEITYPYSVMNNVMTIIKDENILQTDHRFDLDCRIIIKVRASDLERITKRFSRIEGLELKFLPAG